MNYKSLLKPFNTTIETTALGQKIFIRRLTNSELDNYSEIVSSEDNKLTNRDRSLIGVNLFLSALVNEDGSSPKNADLPSAESLLDAHSTADLLAAVKLVQQHSYGTLEDAIKN